MQTEEFIRISPEAVMKILCERYGYHDHETDAGGQRKQMRWPFPSTIEVWQDGEDDYRLGQALNLSLGGVGAVMDSPLIPGRRLNVAIHEPEATLYGEVTVRHCAATGDKHHVGFEFVYEMESEAVQPACPDI